MKEAIRVRRLVDGRVYERRIRSGQLVTDEALRLLGVSRRMLGYYVERGALHPHKIRGRLRFSLAELLKFRRKRG